MCVTFLSLKFLQQEQMLLFRIACFCYDILFKETEMFWVKKETAVPRNEIFKLCGKLG